VRWAAIWLAPLDAAGHSRTARPLQRVDGRGHNIRQRPLIPIALSIIDIRQQRVDALVGAVRAHFVAETGRPAVDSSTATVIAAVEPRAGDRCRGPARAL
jgi:hypothetical protein